MLSYHGVCVYTVCVHGRACALSGVQLFATLWTVAHQAFLSMEFSKQGYWSRLTFFQGRHTDAQQAHEKMLNMSNYLRNLNQTCHEISAHTNQNGHH